MRILYNSLLSALRPALAAWAAWHSRDPSGRQEWRERRGRDLPEGRDGGVWLHGASVGEARLVAALANTLRERRPACPLAASALTPTGRNLLREVGALDRSFFVPIDVPAWIRATLESVRPSLLTLVETELWPNLILESAARDVPVAIVNARLSEERMRRYRRLRGLYAPCLAALSTVCAQSEPDAERYVELGADPGRVVVTGNLKYDLPPSADTRAEWQSRLRIADTDRVWIAGSTAEGEEERLLPVHAALRGEHRDLRWIVAPRHPERAPAVTRTLRASGWTVSELSSLEPDVRPPEFDILVVDRVGVLGELYRLADVAFVGGSLVPVGGHNLLEPAAVGVPVAFGPHVGHVAEMANALLRASGGRRVEDADELARVLGGWLRHPEERIAVARRGRGVVEGNRGAIDATVEILLARLGERTR